MSDVTLKPIEQIEPYTGPHEIPGIRFRHARKALGVTAWGMNVLEIDPNNGDYPEHDHAGDGQQEVYVVLRGTAVLKIAGREDVTVQAGDLVHVAPACKRKFVTLGEGVTLLAIGATPGEAYEPAGGF